jgi:ATP-dependent DNA helicase RecG
MPDLNQTKSGLVFQKMYETNRIEFKQELTDSLEKEVVAFLNYKEGGIIYIGINKTGLTTGVANIDSDQLKIKDRLKYNIVPSCLGLFDVVSEHKMAWILLK